MSTELVHLLEQNSQSYVSWTKLTIPQLSGTHLKRSRLVDKMHGLIDRKLILVRAQAGYGKTSMLVELAHDTDLQVCWYTIEDKDSDLSVFLTYLIASVARRFPSFGHRSLRLLQTIGSQIQTQIRVFAATMADEIFATIPEYFFLILDDYHTLTADSSVHEFIRLLLDFMPEQCHMIISSRTVPPLPMIRLVARQQMAAIGIDELRFTDQEIQRLIANQFSSRLSIDQARSLLRQTDGWITAIWLSADMGWEAVLKNDGALSSNLTETGIYDYLMSEVFDCQPLQIQQFLLHTAVLRDMTLSLCNELLEQDCSETLQTLQRSSLFVTRVEEIGIDTTYRYHPLFHSFLMNRLREQQIALYHKLSARAADIFSNRQDWPAVIYHSLNAEQFAQAKQVILRHFDHLNTSGLRESVARWIDALPPQHISPDLQLKRAMLAADLGQIDTALRLYANAIVLFESMNKQADLALTLTERSFALSKIGRYADAIQDCEQVLSLLVDAPNADSLRGRAYRYLGRFHGETGDAQTALHYLSLAHTCWEQCGESPVRKARLAQDMGMAYELQGQFAAAIRHYAIAQSEWARLGNEGEIAYALNGIGVARHRLGEYQTAQRVLHDALETSQKAGSLRAEAYTLASLGDLYRDLGQCEQAIALYDQSRAKAELVGEAFLRSYIATARMEALFLTGHVESAQIEIETALSTEQLSRSVEARYRLTLAAALIAQRDSERARHEIDQALHNSGTQNELAFRGHMQLAEIAMLQNCPQETSTHLHTAFQLAQDAGLTQPLCVESLNRMQVLHFAVQKGTKTIELDKWIAAAQELDQIRKELLQLDTLYASNTQQPKLVINALGTSCVNLDDQSVSWRTTQTKELFFYLLTHPNGQTKEQIGAAIWRDHSQARLFSIFRSSLFRVRKAIFADIIQFKDEQYALNPDIVFTYDVADFEQEITQGDLADTEVQKAFHYRRAVHLYQGPLLEDLYSDWIDPLREALQNQYLQALTFLAKFNVDRGRYPRAIEYARRIIASDEYYEIAYYLLVQAYARSGQRPQAKRIYAQCREMLTEFGLSPQKRWEDLCR